MMRRSEGTIDFRGSLRGLRLLVLGYGREGSSAARFLTKHEGTVTVADKSVTSMVRIKLGESSFDLSPENLGLLRDTDVLVVSPGVPESNALLADAIQAGVPVTSPTEIFFQRCANPIVGITGTSGKSTTTSLIAAILRADGAEVALGGNIGIPMLDLLDGFNPQTIPVLELSSFQLQSLTRSPHLSVVTNVSPNHLDRHGDMASYVRAKQFILRHQTSDDFAVLNAEDVTVREMGEVSHGHKWWFGWNGWDGPGAFVENNWIVLSNGRGSEQVMELDGVPLLGRHNIENVLAALAAAGALGSSVAALQKGVENFQSLPHRLETVARTHHVAYVDDSIATSPERAAVGVLAAQAPLVLLAGGRSKGLPWRPMLDAMDGKVHTVILFGEAARELQQAIRQHDWRDMPSVRTADGFEDAIQMSQQVARSGDTVLLSPGCTSYDMFSNFEERGEAFKGFIGEQYGSDR